MLTQNKKAADAPTSAARMEEASASSLSYPNSTKFPLPLSRKSALSESTCGGGV